MKLPSFIWAQPGLAEQVARAKGRDRLALAALPPAEAQALVSSGLAQGVLKIRLPAKDTSTLGAADAPCGG